MADVKKKTKMYFTNLHSNKDGKDKDGEIKMKAQGQTHVWLKEDEDATPVASAPFYFRKVTGDFTATVKVKSKMEYWLDAAGLLVQEKRGVYTKVALEYHDDPQKVGNPNYFAAAYVHPKEELEMYKNVTPYPKQFKRKDKKYDYVQLENDPQSKVAMWLKVTKKGKEMLAYYSMDGTEWVELKKSKFTYAKTLSVGVFCASGSGESKGLKATFENLKIEEDPNWVDKPDWEVDFLAEAQEAAADDSQNKEVEYVDFARKAAEEEEAMMMAKLAALTAGLSGDSDAAEAAGGAPFLLDESKSENVEAPDMDFSAKMREMASLRSSIMGGGKDGDDSDASDNGPLLVDTSDSGGDSPVQKRRSILDDDSDSDDDSE